MKNNIKNSKPKVFVGLSGGVDSAVSAALLKKEGYDVTGVFIKAWEPPFESAQGTRKYPCGWKEDRRSAMRAAAVLDIPFLTLDLEKEYKKEVVDYMIAEYKMGRTPNPDVMCNKEIKFGHFLNFALANGADFVATGHYAIRYENHSKATKNYENYNEILGGSHPSLVVREGLGMSYELCEGKDKNKDQSYFLWTLTQAQLKHILFPIGHLQKSEVRKLAGKFGLPQETRKDSQGLCFLGKIDMKEFLIEYIGTKRGKVLLENGEVIGEHDGAVLYTIGERHGFSVNNKNTKSEPLYVISKNLEKNTITVAPKFLPSPASSLPAVPARRAGRGSPSLGERGEVILANINLIHPTSLKLRGTKEKLSCRIRYRGEKIPCRVKNNKVFFDTVPFDISPGQSLVLYDGEICLGGGIIV